MKYAGLLLLALSLHGVAGEVGAPNPQSVLTTASNSNDVAANTAVTGASPSLATAEMSSPNISTPPES